jgi:hypothetical protein
MLHLLTFLSFFSAFTAGAGNPWGIDYSVFDIRPHQPGRYYSTFYSQLNLVQGNSIGLFGILPVSGSTTFTLGMRYSTISFQEETQGVFPETGQYGFIIANGKLNYWTFPVTLAVMHASNYRNSRRLTTGVRIMYLPSFEHDMHYETSALGGALQSAYLRTYQVSEQKFQHAFALALTNQVYFSRKCKLTADPYIGVGNSFFRFSGNTFNDLTYGIRFSFQFPLPKLSLEWERPQTSKEQQDKLKQKQKEIEEQLKKKPK